MSKKFKIVVPDEFRRWESGLQSMEVGPAEAQILDQATDLMFAETQRLVHVLSGDLKSSGRVVPAVIDGQTVSAEIEYGGVMGTEGMVDYAEYELARGGSHDFIRPALRTTEAMFREAILDMVLAMLTRKVT